jgi:hypothetical protein
VLISIVFFIIDIILWVIVSIAEGNPSIALIHIALTVPAIILILAFGFRLALPFSVALILRSFFAIAAWYTAFSNHRRYLTGTNSDSSRFWEASFLSYQDASLSFEDPFFPRLNVFITQISAVIGEPSYLATTQTTLLAGALTVLFIQLLAEDIYGSRTGRITAYLVALCPVAIVFSTGLMRDSLMWMFGSLFLFAINRLLQKRSITLNIFYIIAVVGSGISLAYLRSLTLATFVASGLIIAVSSTPSRIYYLTKKNKFLIFLALIFIFGFSVFDRPDRYLEMFKYADGVRAGTVKADGATLNSAGITTAIGEISPALYLLFWPITLLQPIPFFNWDAPSYEPGPTALMDIVLGFGGLYIQALFGFFIFGARYWILARDALGVRVGIFLNALICTFVMMGLGQVRMVMASCYTFLFIGIAIGIIMLVNYGYLKLFKVLIYWSFFMFFLYLFYFSYKYQGIFFSLILMVPSMISLWLFWNEFPLNYLRNKSKEISI